MINHAHDIVKNFTSAVKMQADVGDPEGVHIMHASQARLYLETCLEVSQLLPGPIRENTRRGSHLRFSKPITKVACTSPRTGSALALIAPLFHFSVRISKGFRTVTPDDVDWSVYTAIDGVLDSTDEFTQWHPTSH